MRLIAALMFVVFASCAFAQAVSEQRRKSIEELLEITGSLKLGEQVGNAMSQQMINTIRAQQPNMPPRIAEIVQEVTQDHMRKFMNDPATLNSMVDMYANHFTDQEIQDIVAFYKTPAGMKLTSEMPKLTAESMQFTQARMTTVIPALQQELMQRLEAEGFGSLRSQPQNQPQPQP